ncbi:hypothetical protein [Plebeiibacterium marinum]|uniref:Uncharacterized protein n=1 Tax=Plebeiibacterium marinum TaxID=2992111 RepID=A0AAE3SLN8_9BACT|nr:hypothetical protein [Plebeiobacterium marinum]MCW3807669.1 hypothetical protein [Plebeiobacterium marinum]
MAQENPVKKTLATIEKDNQLAYYKMFNQSYPFYIKKTIKKLEHPKELKAFLTDSPKAIVFTQQKRIKNIDISPFAQIIFQQKDIFEGHTTVVLKSIKSTKNNPTSKN